MADLIDVATFEARSGRTLSTIQTIQVAGFISDASALVADLVGDATVTDLWDTVTVPGSLVPIIVKMVRRELDNPLGFTGENTEGYSYAGAYGSGVFATRDEERAIRRAVHRSSAGSLNLSSYLPYSPADPMPIDTQA